MYELYKLGIDEETILEMVNQVPNIPNLSEEDIQEKIIILNKAGCTERQMRDIISSNPMYLDSITGDNLKLIHTLKEYGFTCLNILFDSNPYILNLESFEIKDYIKARLESGEELEDIVDDLDSNPILFNEM